MACHRNTCMDDVCAISCWKYSWYEYCTLLWFCMTLFKDSSVNKTTYILNAYSLIAEGKHCRNFMVKQLYEEMEERAKKVAEMDRKSRLNTVWDLAEEFKVSNKIELTKFSGL